MSFFCWMASGEGGGGGCTPREYGTCCVCSSMRGRWVRDGVVMRRVCEVCLPVVNPWMQQEYVTRWTVVGADDQKTHVEFGQYLDGLGAGAKVVIELDGRVYIVCVAAGQRVPALVRVRLGDGPVVDVTDLVEPLRTALRAVLYYAGKRRPVRADDYCSGVSLVVTHCVRCVDGGMVLDAAPCVEGVCCVVLVSS